MLSAPDPIRVRLTGVSQGEAMGHPVVAARVREIAQTTAEQAARLGEASGVGLTPEVTSHGVRPRGRAYALAALRITSRPPGSRVPLLLGLLRSAGGLASHRPGRGERW